MYKVIRIFKENNKFTEKIKQKKKEKVRND